MHANRIALAFVLAGLATPALAEKCSVCDFSDEPIVVKPTGSSGTPSVSEIVVTKLSDGASAPLLSDRDRPLQVGTAPQPGKSDDAPTETGSFAYDRVVSSKPKEIVVVGSKVDAAAKVDGQHALTSVRHAARLPAPTVVAPAGPPLPRGAGPAALPANVEFGAAPATRR